MSGLHQMLGQLLQPETVGQVSDQTGLSRDTTSSLVSAALPLLVSGLARNAQRTDGAGALASALQRDHDGSVLDDIGGFLGSGQASSAGAGILGHVFGGRTDAIASALGRSAGVDAGQAQQVLAMLAPLVLGALGRTTRQENLGADVLAERLQEERQQLPGGSQLGGLLTSLLDQDGDGQVLDDLAGLAKRFMS